MRILSAIVSDKNTMRALLKETQCFRVSSQILITNTILKLMLESIQKRPTAYQLHAKHHHWETKWLNNKNQSQNESHLYQKWNCPKNQLLKIQGRKTKTSNAKSPSTLKMYQTRTLKILTLAGWSIAKSWDKPTIQKGTLYVTDKRKKAPNIYASICTAF